MPSPRLVLAPEALDAPVPPSAMARSVMPVIEPPVSVTLALCILATFAVVTLANVAVRLVRVAFPLTIRTFESVTLSKFSVWIVTLSSVTLLIMPPVMVTLLDFRFASISEPLLMPLIALESVEKSLS